MSKILFERRELCFMMDGKVFKAYINSNNDLYVGEDVEDVGYPLEITSFSISIECLEQLLLFAKHELSREMSDMGYKSELNSEKNG